MDRVQFKLKIKKYFKGWGLDQSGKNKKKKLEINEELAQLEQVEEQQPLTSEQFQRRVFIHTELMKLLELEELFWVKRNHETWLLKGDNNTEYYHRVANGRKRKNTIFSLKHEESIIKGDASLLRHATEYYKNLFGRENGNAFNMNPNLWVGVTQVNNEDNWALTKPFEEEEIKEALLQMEKNKAAGPDKIPIEFYQHCWEIIKEDIVAMFNDF